MRGWQQTNLSPDLRVDVVVRPDLDDAGVLAEVDRLWSEACLANPALFNGRVLSADHVSTGRIVGHWTDYKLAYAQIRRPALFGALGVRPVAVCGVVHGPDGIVFGRRGVGAIYQPGLWQCPSAGSIERRAADYVDLTEQVGAEFEEELGLPWHPSDPVRPLCAVEHPNTHVVDIGLAIMTAYRGPDILAAHRKAVGRAEYDELAIVPVDRVEARLAAWAGSVVPSALSFVRSLLQTAS